MTELTREEQREEQARMAEEVRAAFRIFLSPEGKLVLNHMRICWYGSRTPATQLGNGSLDTGLTLNNVGKQGSYFDVLRWVEFAEQAPRGERQTTATRAAPER